MKALRRQPSRTLPVERGIPLPPWKAHSTNRKGPRLIRPWSAMEIGDSFFELAEGQDVHRLQGSLASTASWLKKERGLRFETRIVEGGVRVWRTR